MTCPLGLELAAIAGDTGLFIDDGVPADCDPLGPDNNLYVITGPLTGCGMPATPRFSVAAKSPLTGIWGEANSGAFIWKIEHRHGYGDPPPSGFALGELGYVGIQEPPFSDQGFRTTNLYWRQRLNGGRATIIAGFLEPVVTRIPGEDLQARVRDVLAQRLEDAS